MAMIVSHRDRATTDAVQRGKRIKNSIVIIIIIERKNRVIEIANGCQEYLFCLKIEYSGWKLNLYF